MFICICFFFYEFFSCLAFGVHSDRCLRTMPRFKVFRVRSTLTTTTVRRRLEEATLLLLLNSAARLRRPNRCQFSTRITTRSTMWSNCCLTWSSTSVRVVSLTLNVCVRVRVYGCLDLLSNQRLLKFCCCC